MPERIFDVYIEGYVWPDKVDVYLHNDECVDARSYVSKDLYESVSAANDAWQDENAKLQHELELANDQCEKAVLELLDQQGQLEAENAKLRELANAMAYCIQGKCLECPMCSPFDTSIGGAPECRATLKLRELGVEVDE